MDSHYFSLQWISWDYYGKVEFSKGESDNTYIAKGGQKSENNDDYIEIEGVITPVNEKHLMFDSVIISKVYHMNKACKREGIFNFKAFGERKYWRLQEIVNPCDSGADYIDIFFY